MGAWTDATQANEGATKLCALQAVHLLPVCLLLAMHLLLGRRGPCMQARCSGVMRAA